MDVPLASTKTSNYYNAISMALKLLTDMNNRDTHVSTDICSDSDDCLWYVFWYHPDSLKFRLTNKKDVNSWQTIKIRV